MDGDEPGSATPAGPPGVSAGQPTQAYRSSESTCETGEARCSTNEPSRTVTWPGTTGPSARSAATGWMCDGFCFEQNSTTRPSTPRPSSMGREPPAWSTTRSRVSASASSRAPRPSSQIPYLTQPALAETAEDWSCGGASRHNGAATRHKSSRPSPAAISIHSAARRQPSCGTPSRPGSSWAARSPWASRPEKPYPTC